MNKSFSIYGKKCITAKIQKSSEEVNFIEGLDKFGAIEVAIEVDLTCNKSCKSVKKDPKTKINFKRYFVRISLQHTDR
mgnify:CR=1 FL=1